MRQSPTRRRSLRSSPLMYLMSPWKGSVSISSIAARRRARSRGGTRSRDLRAGPARVTTHFFFSAEFIEGYAVAALDRSLSAADGAELGGRRSLLGQLPNRDVRAECFTDQFGPSPVLCAHGFLDLIGHLGRQRNCEGLARSHGSFVPFTGTYYKHLSRMTGTVKRLLVRGATLPHAGETLSLRFPRAAAPRALHPAFAAAIRRGFGSYHRHGLHLFG